MVFFFQRDFLMVSHVHVRLFTVKVVGFVLCGRLLEKNVLGISSLVFFFRVRYLFFNILF